METTAVEPPYDQLMETAEQVAAERPEVDPELAREVFLEAATLLHNGLALDGLDEHDARTVVAGLCDALVSADPGAAVAALAEEAGSAPDDHHDPRGVAASYRVSAVILQL